MNQQLVAPSKVAQPTTLTLVGDFLKECMEFVRNLAFSITVIAVASPLITQYWPMGRFATPHRVAVVVISIGTAYALSACITFISRIHSRHPKYQIISIVILTALMIPMVVASLGISARWIDWIAAQHLTAK